MNKTKLSIKLNEKTLKFKNIIRRNLKIKSIFAITIFIMIFAVVLSPKKYTDVALCGILVWATNVLPALFPFIVFSRLLTATGYVESFSKIFSKPVKKLYKCPAISAYVFLISILAGYPLGAKLVSDLFCEGKITRSEAHRICSFTSNSGPMFIIGTVGAGMLASKTAGIIILCSHIFGALLNGLLYRNYKPKEIELKILKKQKLETNDVLTETMFNGINSILLVGGYITIFFVITEVFSSLGFFVPFSILLSKFGISTTTANALCFGIFEMTKGCLFITSANATLLVRTCVCCFLISFGGLAISFQALSFLNKFKISKKFFFTQKTTQAIISVLLCAVLCLIFL